MLDLFTCFLIIYGIEFVTGGYIPPIECASTPCGVPTCSEPVIIPGQCCPVCPPTVQDRCRGQECSALPVGCAEMYIPEEQCCPVCRRDTYLCSGVRCATPRRCENSYIPVGQCCPVCREGCRNRHDGKYYSEGERIPDINPCIVCTCRLGIIECINLLCRLPPPQDNFLLKPAEPSSNIASISLQQHGNHTTPSSNIAPMSLKQRRNHTTPPSNIAPMSLKQRPNHSLPFSNIAPISSLQQRRNNTILIIRRRN